MADGTSKALAHDAVVDSLGCLAAPWVLFVVCMLDMICYVLQMLVLVNGHDGNAHRIHFKQLLHVAADYLTFMLRLQLILLLSGGLYFSHFETVSLRKEGQRSTGQM